MKKQAGFTIVELVVVIALLGILAAVALPRFLNVTDDAHKASVSGTGGALRSAVALVKAQAVIDQVKSGDIDFDDNASTGTGGKETYVNAKGFPQGASSASAANCVVLWKDVLQEGRPSAETTAGSDYKVTYASSTCTFTYQADTTLKITYKPSTGEVTVP